MVRVQTPTNPMFAGSPCKDSVTNRTLSEFTHRSPPVFRIESKTASSRRVRIPVDASAKEITKQGVATKRCVLVAEADWECHALSCV